MPVSEAQKRAIKKYVEKNAEAIKRYKAEFYQKNKEKYSLKAKERYRQSKQSKIDPLEEILKHYS